MRRVLLILSLVALGLLGCHRSSAPRGGSSVSRAGRNANLANQGPVRAVAGINGRPGMSMSVSLPSGRGTAASVEGADQTTRDQYEAAMSQAMMLFADRQYAEARKYLKLATLCVDSEAVRTALFTTSDRLNEEAIAERVAADIQVVIDEGQAAVAVRLANSAWLLFANTTAAEQIANLARQAHALQAVAIDDREARFHHFATQYREALGDKSPNLRAAALALEFALQNGDDAELKQQRDDLQKRLIRYDELRADADRLRRQTSRLEEALAKLEAAAKIWLPAALQQEIDDCRQNLSRRRDRLAVATFEVRGDVGLADAGAVVADELMPAFKGRFELVARSQIAKVVDTLKTDNLIDDDLARQKVGQAVQARFLIVGSIAPVAGLSICACLVDVQTGLIVQTGRIGVARIDELGKRLPQLAEQLLMTDSEKRKCELNAEKDATGIAPLKPDASVDLPPPPAPTEAPPPLIPIRPRSPAQPANILPQQFMQLPLVPATGAQFVLTPLNADHEREIRRRCAVLALELGDNLFQRGQFRDAFRNFEFCMTLCPENRHVRWRCEHCRGRLPPSTAARPRLAILDFLTFGEDRLLPPILGAVIAENIAPHLGRDFELVDRAELFWWMGRLGLTCGDLISDPVARVYLARALNTRFFQFGTLEWTGSFDVSTFMIDAQLGFLISTARIHVENTLEMNLRLSELVWLTRLAPDERARVERDSAAWNLLIADLQLRRQRFLEERSERPDTECQAVIDMGAKALKQRPNNVQVLDLVRDAKARLQQLATEEAGRKEQERRDALLTLWWQQKSALDHDAAEARQKAQQHQSADQQRLHDQRQAAATALEALAQQSARRQEPAVACQFLAAAAALRPDDAAFHALAQARINLEASAAARAKETVAAAARCAQEAATARGQLEEECRQRAAAVHARGNAAEERDRLEAGRLLKLARQSAAQGQLEQAVGVAWNAKQLRASVEAERELSQLLIALARANAEKRGAAAKAELENELAVERDAQANADIETKNSRQRYDDLLAQGDAALEKGQFAAAIERFRAARQIFQTDAATTRLQNALAALAHADAKVSEQQQLNERQRTDETELKRQLAEARAAYAAGQFDKAVQCYRMAQALASAEAKVKVLAGLARAEQARDREQITADRKRWDDEHKASIQRMLVGAAANMDDQRFDAAVMSLRHALKLEPENAEARAALAKALSRISDRDKADADKNQEIYDRLMADGRRALSSKRFEQAIQSFRSADQLSPGDKLALSLVEESSRAKSAEDDDLRQEAQQRANWAKKAADLAVALSSVRFALAAGQLHAAAASAKAAAQLDPNNSQVIRAQADVRGAQAADAAAKQKLQSIKSGK